MARLLLVSPESAPEQNIPLISQTAPSRMSSPTSLIDERFEHDSCGVGFVASALGKADHLILQQALTALARLAHRGAVAADGASSDGVGLMTAVPRPLLLQSTGVELGADETLGVGMLFLPEGEKNAEAVIESCLRSQDLRVLAWRDVPTRPEVLGRNRAKHAASDSASTGRGCGGFADRADGAAALPGAQAV